MAVLFFLPPFILFLMWITLGWRYDFMSEGEKKNTFLSSFPEWMQHFSAKDTNDGNRDVRYPYNSFRYSSANLMMTDIRTE